MKKLVLPHNRYCAVDYFLEVGDPKKETGIKIDMPAYNRLKEDPYLEIVSSTETDETWFGDEVTINGKHYPPLEFKLHKIIDGYVVLMIKDNDTEYFFSEVYSVEITWE